MTTNNTYKAIYKIKDSYFAHFLEKKENALEMLFDFCKEYENDTENKLLFSDVMANLEKLENAEIDIYVYYPFTNSSSPYISFEFNSKTEKKFLKDFQNMLDNMKGC